MTDRQRAYYWAEVLPAIAEGIDLLLISAGRLPWGWTAEDVHERWKDSVGVVSTTQLSPDQANDYITEILAFASNCMIFVASSEEWFRGIDEREREAHYAYVLENEGDGLRRAA